MSPKDESITRAGLGRLAAGERKTVVVIGGGVSGLATAALLARRGHAVTLVEKNPTLGGRAGSRESGGFRWDTGPSWYLMPEVFAQFYSLLGMTPED
ncbi:FAD-dependent oxidoreductase, partial [Dietzia timorensis]